MDNIFSKNRVRLLFSLSLLIYLTVGSLLPEFLAGTIIGEALLWPVKLIELIKNIALSIVASCVFYYFIVYMPEQKQKASLNKLINTKVDLVYNQSVGVAWVLVSTHQLRGAGIPFEMGKEFIKEWCLKTDVTQKEHSQVPRLMYEHWLVAKTTAKELSDILTRNIALTDHNLLEHLQDIQTTNFDIPANFQTHPQVLEVIESRITDLYEKGEALRKYYESIGGVLKNT